MASVGILDCGISNITSVRNALEFLGCVPRVLKSPEAIPECSHLVLPGVGAFKSGMERIRAGGFAGAIKAHAAADKPLLGICLGMQLLALSSEEFGHCEGLGMIPGRVDRIPAAEGFRLPHIGWNDVETVPDCPLFRGLEARPSFYFVHTYAYAAEPDAPYVAATCDYSTPVVAAVRSGNSYGVQFHPEKSQKSGLKVLGNFLALC
jgi:glutamine amidotransferase